MSSAFAGGCCSSPETMPWFFCNKDRNARNAFESRTCHDCRECRGVCIFSKLASLLTKLIFHFNTGQTPKPNLQILRSSRRGTCFVPHFVLRGTFRVLFGCLDEADEARASGPLLQRAGRRVRRPTSSRRVQPEKRDMKRLKMITRSKI